MVEAIKQAAAIRIQSGGVTLDLGGFGHDLHQGIEVLVGSEVSRVTIRNGRLLGSGVIRMQGLLVLNLQSIIFEGGGVEVDYGDTLLVEECHFFGSPGDGGSAVYGGQSEYVIRDSVFKDYTEAIAIYQLNDQDSLTLSSSRFAGNRVAITVNGHGQSEVSIDNCHFDGAGMNIEQQPQAFEFEGELQVGFEGSTIRNYELVFNFQSNPAASLLVENSKLTRFNAVIDIDGPDPEFIHFQSTTFDGGSDGNPANRFFQSPVPGVSAGFTDCTFSGFDELTPVPSDYHLTFERCVFDYFGKYDWPDGSVVSNSSLTLRDGLTTSFNSGVGSRFTDSNFVARANFPQAFRLQEGAVVEGCAVIDFQEGIKILHHSALLRDCAITFDPSNGSGQVAVLNLDGDEREAALLENCTIRGYQTALEGGNFQAHQLVINGCEKAFDNIGHLQLSGSSVSVENLGEVHDVAWLTDSNLRTSNESLWVGQLEMLNCSVSNQDESSARGLEIHHGGSIRNSTISGFFTGIYAQAKISIDASTISRCVEAVRIAASGAVLTNNTVVACNTGIDAGTNATVVGNTVSVQLGGISGSGLIVKNVVTVTSGPAYNFGGGTIGRELTGSAINPNPSPSVEDAGEPWANVWESF